MQNGVYRHAVERALCANSEFLRSPSPGRADIGRSLPTWPPLLFGEYDSKCGGPEAASSEVAMAKDVAVFNAPPVYVMGLHALSDSSGYRFESVADPMDWVERNQFPAILVGLRDQGDLDVVVDLTEAEPDSVVVTVVDDYDVDSVRDSLAAGASGAVSRDAGAADVLLALNAALTRSTVLPTALARVLIAELGEREPPCLESFELDWLQSMARNTTVARLGRLAGYSEREMYRRLRTIYYKMGVSNRTEALLKASRLGWIH